MKEIQHKDRIFGGIFGLAVGDALGVPVEFKSRQRLQNNPVTDMIAMERTISRPERGRTIQASRLASWTV